MTEVLPGGDLEVTHWIHAEDPIDELGLTLPELDGAEVSATDVEVTADGRAASGPATVAPSGATYAFADATRIQVRYRMSGAVELSSSADGRGLATTTSLDVTATQARDVRVVRSQEVLSLACAEPEEQPLPCGKSEGDDQWRVELAGTDVGEPRAGRGDRPVLTEVAQALPSRPCSMAQRVSCTRLFICSLRRVFWTWFCTVRCDRTRRAAICL